MPYALTSIQQAAFSQTFEVWKRVSRVSRTGTSKTKDGFYYTLSASGVRGRIGQKSEASAPTPVGRSNYDVLDTTDVLRLHIDEPMQDAWYVKETGSGAWYIVQGGPQDRHFRAQTATYLIKRATPPPTSGSVPGPPVVLG
jgi:hypothetical protein